MEFFLLSNSNLSIRKVSLTFLVHHIFLNLLLIRVLFPIQMWCFLKKRHLSKIDSTFCCQSTRWSASCWAELVQPSHASHKFCVCCKFEMPTFYRPTNFSLCARAQTSHLRSIAPNKTAQIREEARHHATSLCIVQPFRPSFL